jgi:hypothetical protein
VCRPRGVRPDAPLVRPRTPIPVALPVDGVRPPRRGAPAGIWCAAGTPTPDCRASGGAAHCAGPPLTAQGRLRRRYASAARPLTCEPLRPLWADARAGQGLPIPARGATGGGSPGRDQRFGAKRANFARRRAEPLIKAPRSARGMPGRGRHAPVLRPRTPGRLTPPVDGLRERRRSARADKRCVRPQRSDPRGRAPGAFRGTRGVRSGTVTRRRPGAAASRGAVGERPT